MRVRLQHVHFSIMFRRGGLFCHPGYAGLQVTAQGVYPLKTFPLCVRVPASTCKRYLLAKLELASVVTVGCCAVAL